MDDSPRPPGRAVTGSAWAGSPEEATVTQVNRGLDLSDVSSVTGPERDQFSA